MKYVIEGEDVSKLLRENQLRIKRGTLKVYPLDEEAPEKAVDDAKEVEAKEADSPITDTKDVPVTDTKEVKPAEKKKSKSTKKK